MPTLHGRKKWHVHSENIRVVDIVLIVEANTPRGKWPQGCVMRVYPGADGVVRSATVKTETSEFDRPVTKLSVLERVDVDDTTDPTS